MVVLAGVFGLKSEIGTAVMDGTSARVIFGGRQPVPAGGSLALLPASVPPQRLPPACLSAHFQAPPARISCRPNVPRPRVPKWKPLTFPCDKPNPNKKPELRGSRLMDFVDVEQRTPMVQ